MNLVHKKIPSPVGQLTLIANATALVAILWEIEKPGRTHFPASLEEDHHPVLTKTERQLEEYFAGRRSSFDLPLEPIGTPFQKSVWTALGKIPYGQTSSYGALAASIGSPKSSRAVGGATGRNPLSIVVPCHRLIGATGHLTGFAGGLDRKKLLLALETRATGLRFGNV